MLEVQNVSAGYNGFDVLHDISFKVLKGEKLGIIGPNGCGKSTLLKALANLIPFKGEISIEDTPIKAMKRKDVAKKIGLLSQITHVYFSYTVFETVMMGRFAHGNNSLFSKDTKEDKEAVEEALNAVYMFDVKDKEINELSGGQLQRVFLAKVLAQNPEIILLDEPTNHLDLTYQVEFIKYLNEWTKKEVKITVSVLHDINHALSFSDKILVLDKGRIKGYGNVDDIVSSSLLNEVYNMDIASYMKNSLRRWEGLKLNL